jgi:hypothetical protein
MVRSTGNWHTAALVAALTATAPTAGAQSPALNRGDVGAAPVYSADVEIEESIVDEHGAVVEARPKTRYRMAMRRTARGLQTEIVYPEARLFPKGPLTDPRGGMRIVSDGDLATARIYDARGQVILGPQDTAEGPAVEAVESGVTQESGMVLSDRGARGRRSDFERRFGPSLGRLDGRDRYLASQGDELTETLVEPSTMLPVEINVARGGALAHRTSMAYGRMPGGRWYLATTRSELALPDDTGRRFVSKRSYLNVVSQEAR